MSNPEIKARLEGWSHQSSDKPGFHAVIAPETSECQEAQVFRLNLPKGKSYTLKSGELEMHPVLIEGEAVLSGHPALDQSMK